MCIAHGLSSSPRFQDADLAEGREVFEHEHWMVAPWGESLQLFPKAQTTPEERYSLFSKKSGDLGRKPSCLQLVTGLPPQTREPFSFLLQPSDLKTHGCQWRPVPSILQGPLRLRAGYSRTMASGPDSCSQSWPGLGQHGRGFTTRNAWAGDSPARRSEEECVRLS